MTGERDRAHSGCGFTLIEMLVVLTIMATLLTLVVPNYLARIRESDETVLRHNLSAMREAIDRYQGDVGHYPDTLDELVRRRYLRDIPIDPVTGRHDSWRMVKPQNEEGVYDVKSGAQGHGADGTPYQDW